MRIGSLFSGYGGLDMAVGGQLAWYAEIEPAACQVMEAHYPDIPNLGDVTKVNWANVEPVDVITGGYPCQPFSRAGIRRGTEDERHLWPYIFDAIRALEPRYAVLENVPGHLTLGFADVLADLASIGWDAEWGTLRASDIGAPHTRNRLFIITYAKGSHESGSKHECLSTERAIEPGKCDCSSTYSNSDGYGGGQESGGMETVAGSDAKQTRQREWAWEKPFSGITWNNYESAIRRWEGMMNRAAPYPIIQVKEKKKVNPVFVEWMMGLPEGWVTGHGLSASQELKMLGNGVVPQQAALALRLLGFRNPAENMKGAR